MNLYEAAKNGDLETVKKLVLSGSDIHAENDWTYCPGGRGGFWFNPVFGSVGARGAIRWAIKKLCDQSVE